MQIPAGSYTMGGAQRRDQAEQAAAMRLGRGEPDPRDQPAHAVTITSVCMGKYEVTQEQWQAVMGDNPSRFKDPFHTKCLSCPVEMVSWNMAQKFIAKLNAASKDGWKYRLPTEAEWEYAARAGLADLGDLDPGSGWTANMSNKEGTQSVGGKPGNAWGLHDMEGNVAEWCEDRWHPNYNGAPTDGSAWLSGETADRVIRGTSFMGRAFKYLHAADRTGVAPDAPSDAFGLRVVAFR